MYSVDEKDVQTELQSSKRLDLLIDRDRKRRSLEALENDAKKSKILLIAPVHRRYSRQKLSKPNIKKKHTTNDTILAV